MKMPPGIEKWGSGILGLVSVLLVANLVNQFRHTRNALDSQHAQILLISGISDF